MSLSTETIPKARKLSPAYHGQTLTPRNMSTSTTPDNIDKAEHLFAGFLQRYEEKTIGTNSLDFSAAKALSILYYISQKESGGLGQ